MSDEIEPPLSARQIECLRFAARGMTSLQIAAELGISFRTVDQYVSGACRKLKVRNRTQAVAKATEFGLLAAEQ